MILKTVTGPTIRDALADARRLFGDDVVMLQSTPPAAGTPASVTVAFDEAPTVDRRPVAPVAAPAAAPAPATQVAPRTYGYGAVVRNASPLVAEDRSVAAPIVPAAPIAPVAHPIPAPVVHAPVAPPAPSPVQSAPQRPDEMQQLRDRLARLEAALSEARVTVPPARPPVVFVGPGGGGKTSLAVRLARRPEALGATSAAVVVVAPEGDAFVDPTPLLWTLGVPAVVVRSADDVRDALGTFSDADLILVDTPALPLNAARGTDAIQRLGTILAPMAPLDVHLVLDAARDTATLAPETLAGLGLRPDALALTRLDEAMPAARMLWADRLGLPVRLASDGTDREDVSAEAMTAPVAEPQSTLPAAFRPTAAPSPVVSAPVAPAPSAPARTVAPVGFAPTLADTVRTVLAPTTDVPATPTYA